MDQSRKKWVNLSYLAVSSLVGYILFSSAFKIAGKYDLEARVKNIDWFIRLGSIGIAAVLFFILFTNAKANQFMEEVMLELTRVTWPEKKETVRATWVVIVMVLICGVALGGFDAFLAWLMAFIF